VSDRPETVGRPETPIEQATAEWYVKQTLASPETLDAAARTLIGLVTGLLGVLFGVMAVKDKDLPSYFWLDWMRPLAALSVLGLLTALGGGLAVVWPRPLRVSSHRVDQQARALQDLLRAKSRWLRISASAFGLGAAALGIVVIIALLRVV
jgi:hypothetical protein